jgi:hypothetical protein
MCIDKEGVMAVKAKYTWKSEFQFVNFGELLSVMCPYYKLFLLLACLLAFICASYLATLYLAVYITFATCS